MNKYIVICLWKIRVLVGKILGLWRDTSVIPEGEYCYTLHQNEGESITNVKITTCPYYESITPDHTVCKHTGFVGHDLLHWDQCKICSVNH